ncbi:MAG: DNA gyrase inhibitor YacG [Pseudomonadota bacterium]
MSCPICRKVADPRYRPFCSKRCADIDLGKWMRGDYALASEEPLDPEEAEAAFRAGQTRSSGPH